MVLILFEIQLNDGLKIPALGFGTYTLNGIYGLEILKRAVQNGYNLIDSAFNYENEGMIGKAVKEVSVSRDKLIITSKLPGRHHSYKEAVQTIEESLFRAGLDYYDIYLIHWPNPRINLYVEAWQALIEAKKRGIVRSIGVCNFLPEHIERLVKETGVVPSINQIELHPYFNQEAQRKYNKEHNIVTESWSPLGRGKSVFKEKIVEKLALKYNKSASQIVLRWQIQLGNVPIPKANSTGHQIENINIFDFELSNDEINAMNSITRDCGRIKNQDPAVYEEF